MAAPPRRRQSETIIPSLSRLVATESDTRLFLVVTTPAGGSPPLWSPRLGDQVAIVAVTSRGSRESEGFPAADLSNANQVMEAGVLAPGRPVADSIYNVSIVPDGIARVRLGVLHPEGETPKGHRRPRHQQRRDRAPAVRPRRAGAGDVIRVRRTRRPHL